MDEFERSRSLMPPRIRQALAGYQDAEEIRLRCFYPPTVMKGGKEYVIDSELVEERELLYVLELATGASMHSVSSSLQSGYICSGGLRIGVCGQAVFSNGQLVGYRKYYSLAIRIPHHYPELIPAYISEALSSRLCSTLIIAPPGVGKTTALRELVCCISGRGIRVALADERGELLSANAKLGPCTDVLSDVPKAKAAIILLRASNPQLIAMDEITKSEDTESIINVAGCGVEVMATAHGKDLESMRKRPVYKKLLEYGVFEKLLTISIEDGKRQYRLERIDT